MTFSLTTTLQNGAGTETIEHIRRSAPSTYYAQNRMVNGQDYNTYLLKDPTILRAKTINRTFAGQPKYIDWNDASGTYENVKIFGDDASMRYTLGIESQTTSVSGQALIDSVIEPLLNSSGVINMMLHISATDPLTKGVVSSPRRKFIEDNRGNKYFQYDGGPVSTMLGSSGLDGSLKEKTTIQGLIDRHWYGEPIEYVQDTNGSILARIPDPDLYPKDDSRIYAATVPRTIDGVNKFPPGDIGSGLQPIAEQDDFALRYHRYSAKIGVGSIETFTYPSSQPTDVWTIEVAADGQSLYVRSALRGTLPSATINETYQLTAEGSSSSFDFFKVTSESLEPGDAFILDTKAFPENSVKQLGIIINRSDFNAQNYNEAYIHGFTNGVAADVDGSILINNVATVVPHGPLFTQSKNSHGFIVWDRGGTLVSTTVAPAVFFSTRQLSDGTWQYDNNATWVNFTPTSNMFVIGQVDITSDDTGNPGSPPGIASANVWSEAVPLLSFQARPALRAALNLNGWWEVMGTQDLPHYSGGQIKDGDELLFTTDDTTKALRQHGWIIFVHKLRQAPSNNVIGYEVHNRTLRLSVTSPNTKFWFNSVSQIIDNDTKNRVYDNIKVLRSNLDSSDTPNVLGKSQTYDVIGAIKDQDGVVDLHSLEVVPSDLLQEDDSGDLVPDRLLQFETFSAGSYEYFLTSNPSYIIPATDAYNLTKAKNATWSPGSFVDSTLTYGRRQRMPVLRAGGETGLDFMWQHFSPYTNIIDPSVTNIHDAYLMTRGYYDNVINYVRGASVYAPTAPTPLELRNAYGYLLNNKMLSDTVVLHPGKIRLLFGSLAEPQLRARFKVVRSQSGTLTNERIKEEILNVINTFFDIDGWDFGDTFYATKLISLIHQRLPADIASVVLVPVYSTNSFGSLFTVEAGFDEILQSAAELSDIEVVEALTSVVIRQSK